MAGDRPRDAGGPPERARGCESAVASANDALDEAKTELSRLAKDGAPSDATSAAPASLEDCYISGRACCGGLRREGGARGLGAACRGGGDVPTCVLNAESCT